MNRNKISVCCKYMLQSILYEMLHLKKNTFDNYILYNLYFKISEWASMNMKVNSFLLIEIACYYVYKYLLQSYFLL